MSMNNELSAAEHWKTIGLSIKICYGIILVVIVCGISAVQGFLTYNNEENLIELQAKNSCSAIFDNIEQGWIEVKLFAETIAAGFYADNLEVYQSHYTRLSKSNVAKLVVAMDTFQFVKHLETVQEFLDYETQIQSEFEAYNADKTLYPWSKNITWEMFCITQNDTECRGVPPFDPIVYQTLYLNEFRYGFFPRPILSRKLELENAMSNGIFSCSGAITLVGVTDWPRAILCYQALYQDSNGKSVPNVNESQSVYGFVNPIFKINKMMENILGNVGSTQNIITFLYEVTTGDITQPVDLYLGEYPTLPMVDWNIAKNKTEDEHTSGFRIKFSKIVGVGGRDWKIVCAVTDRFFDVKKTNLPYYIAMLSISITIGYNIVRIALKHLILRITNYYHKTVVKTIII